MKSFAKNKIQIPAGAVMPALYQNGFIVGKYISPEWIMRGKMQNRRTANHNMPAALWLLIAVMAAGVLFSGCSK